VWERKNEILAVVDEHGGKAWVTPEEHARLVALTKEEDEHLARIANDPRYRWTRHWVQATRLDPVLGRYDFQVNEEFPPHLIFVQDTGKEADRAEVARLARRNGLLFRELVNSWETKVEPEIRKIPGYESFELPDLGASGSSEIDPPILKVWVFLEEEDLHTYQDHLIGGTLVPGTLAYYRRENQWITLCAHGEDDVYPRDRQDDVTGMTLHVGTHQIIHHYTKLIKDRERAKVGQPRTSFEDMSYRSHWFTEGLPELFSGADETKKDEVWETFMPYHRRVREHRLALTPPRQRRDLYWTLNELVRIPNNAILGRRCNEKTTNPESQRMLFTLFYAEAWTFCHFLWFAEDGKYRPYLVRYLIRELHGQSGFNVFKEVFDDVCPGGDCSKLELKVRAYLSGL
jgi:hypothetical protein